MSWSLSRFRKGDWVEVRSKEEILATLDSRGKTADGMPFMPEMLQFCGRRMRVGAVAHKSCDMVGKVGSARKLQQTVHLEGARCDGAAHGGCQAECYLYWKDQWLKPADSAEKQKTLSGKECTEAQLMESVIKTHASEGHELRYACQATDVYHASRLLPWWDVRQYVFDVTTGNHSVRRVASVLFLAMIRWLQPRAPFGFKALLAFNDWAHLRITGRPRPTLDGKVADGVSSPTGSIGLQEGEYVRVKPQREIELTINSQGRNRGLSFDGEEMAPYCGKVLRVRRRVSRILEETTGRMLEMKQPCIMLDGAVCQSLYASCRLNCPRAIPSYWREIWLERVPAPSGAALELPQAALDGGARRSD